LGVPMHKLSEMAFITLVAYEKQRPHYWVRFSKGVNRKPVILSHMRFYFHDFDGGREEALFWARDWRNWEYQDLVSRNMIGEKGDWPEKIPPCYKTPRSDNSTGKCGIQLVDFYTTRTYRKLDGSVSASKKHAYAFAAIWIEYVEEGDRVVRKYRNRSFSIYKYGKGKARRLASEVRDAAEKYLRSGRHVDLRERYRKG
jgi:hypothetical protein